MLAQVLYDLRDKHGFCDGKDLHRFFSEQTGKPSPAGTVEINDKAAREFVTAGCNAIEHNSPSISMADCRKAINTY